MGVKLFILPAIRYEGTYVFFLQNCYQEHIEIETSQGIFQIPIRAQLPKSDLALPDSLKLGMCAVQESITVNFEVSNIRFNIGLKCIMIIMTPVI